MVQFPTRIHDCDSHSCALLEFFLLTLVFPVQWLSLHWEILIIFLENDSIDSPSNTKRDALLHGMAYDYSRADRDGLPVHLRQVPWDDIFKLIASAAASGFCEWVQVGIDVYPSS